MVDYKKLADIAFLLRQDVVKVTAIAKSGHPGGALSAADFLTVLYFEILNHRPLEPNWEDRDRVIYSKAHSAPVIYPLLSRCGYFDPCELKTLRKLGSRLQGHPARVFNLPGIECSGGSLGQNLSVAAGVALGLRERVKLGIHHNNHIPNVYAVVGDGEMQEGNMWEGVMAAAHHNLENFIVIIDKNKMQIDGTTTEVMNIDPLPDKLESFNWDYFTCDGHNLEDIFKTFQNAQVRNGKPKAIIMHTIKGKGVPLMEGKVEWHGKPPTEEQALHTLGEMQAEQTLEISDLQFNITQKFK